MLHNNIKIFIAAVLATLSVATLSAADPTTTRYTAEQCQGSLMPYPTPSATAVPDSLEAVMINHVGRHGARYPASSKNTQAMLSALERADSLGTITPVGRELMALCRRVMAESSGRWGALDSLGMAEQRGIAARMICKFPKLFDGGRVDAISSYAPRCIMSMYSFTHQLARINNRLEIQTSSGRQNSLLLRPFDVEADYAEFRESEKYKEPYDKYVRTVVTDAALKRVLGKDYPFDGADVSDLALVEYYVVAGMSAMSIECNAYRFFTPEEYNALWSCFNLRQYLQRTATTLSTVPADIASPLLLDLITTTQQAVDGHLSAAVRLRFGHAETLMPLLSLMHLKGCYYMTNYFDTVRLHWRDFYVVPMAANLQMILFKAKRSGRYYVRLDLNESPVPLMPNSDEIYVAWDTARAYLMRCVPIYYQITLDNE